MPGGDPPSAYADLGRWLTRLIASRKTGLRAVEALRPFVPAGATLAQLALRWILMFPAVTCAIPGAKRPAQVEENVRAANLPLLPPETMAAIRAIYDQSIRPHVHHYW